MPAKAIFFEIYGILIEGDEYISSADQVRLRSGAAEALIELKNMGYKLVVASNSKAVAMGVINEDVAGQIHKRLNKLLSENLCRLDGLYYCPYHPEGIITKYRRENNSRKPGPGMLLEAADNLDIELTESWMIGGDNNDVQAGLNAGCKTILLKQSSEVDHKNIDFTNITPDYRAFSLKEAVNIIKKANRSFDEVKVPPEPDLPEEEPLPSEEPPLLPAEAEQEQPYQTEKTEQLLKEILEQLKNMDRRSMFGEFSIMRMMAGIVQIMALACFLICVWFLLSPENNYNSLFIALGFTLVFQIMALTFYLMQGHK